MLNCQRFRLLATGAGVKEKGLMVGSSSSLWVSWKKNKKQTTTIIMYVYHTQNVLSVDDI